MGFAFACDRWRHRMEQCNVCIPALADRKCNYHHHCTAGAQSLHIPGRKIEGFCQEVLVLTVPFFIIPADPSTTLNRSGEQMEMGYVCKLTGRTPGSISRSSSRDQKR